MKKIITTLHKLICDSLQCTQLIDDSWSLCRYPKEISVHNCDALSSLIPCYAVGKMKNLEELTILYCRTITEIFKSQTINNSLKVDEGSTCGGAGTTLTSTRLKNITVIPQLSNLKVVSIFKCDLLQHLFTFSTLESLKQLTSFSVHRCEATQLIVKEENGERTTESRVVVFPRLETLELVDQPKLKGFFLGKNDFRWPLLYDVMIKDCPQMTVFTFGQSKTPKLRYICTSLGKHSLECDLNFHGTTTRHDQVQVSF